MKTFIQTCWTDWAKGQINNIQSIKSYFHIVCDFLLGYNMLLQKKNNYMIEFSDLFFLELKNEDPTPCITIIMIMNNEKINQFE